MATHVIHADQLERELAELLEVEKFPPPKSFREQALVKDDSLYEEAERDLEGFWAKQADRARGLVHGAPADSRTTRTRPSTSGSRTAS